MENCKSTVEIFGGQYLGGMPTFDYKIKINGVGISLNKEDFSELLSKLSAQVAQDYNAALQIDQNYEKKRETVKQFRKDIIKVFWQVDNEDDEDSDWLVRRPEKELDRDKLDEVLEKYNKFLGFE